MARGGAEGGGSGSEIGGRGTCSDLRNRGGRDRGGEGDGDQEVDDALGEGGGPSEGGFLRGAPVKNKLCGKRWSLSPRR